MWFVVTGVWPQMILLFLIMRCTPTIRELIEATPLSPSSPSATSLSALAPAQRAGAQRLCALALFRLVGVAIERRLSGQKRTLERATFHNYRCNTPLLAQGGLLSGHRRQLS